VVSDIDRAANNYYAPGMTITFADWLAKLDAVASDTYGPESMSGDTGTECWALYYEMGYDPKDAWAEDQSYA